MALNQEKPAIFIAFLAITSLTNSAEIIPNQINRKPCLPLSIPAVLLGCFVTTSGVGSFWPLDKERLSNKLLKEWVVLWG